MSTGDLVSVHVTGGAPTVLRVTGQLDVATVPDVEAVLVTLADRDIVVDLAGVTFMGSSGITTLIRAWQRSRETGRSFAVRSPSPPVANVLKVTGVDTVLTVASVD